MASLFIGWLTFHATTSASKDRTADADRAARESAYVSLINDGTAWNYECFDIAGRIKQFGTNYANDTQDALNRANASRITVSKDVLLVQLLDPDGTYPAAINFFRVQQKWCGKATSLVDEAYENKNITADFKVFIDGAPEREQALQSFVTEASADLRPS